MSLFTEGLETETEKVTKTVTKRKRVFPTRYWVSLGYELNEDTPDFAWISLGYGLHNTDIPDFADEFNRKLINLSNKASDAGSLSFVTFDLKEARKVAKNAIALYRKYLPHLEGMCGVLITTQPICPSCGKYGRFSDSRCSRCGADLKLKQYINFEIDEDDPDIEEDEMPTCEYCDKEMPREVVDEAGSSLPLFKLLETYEMDEDGDVSGHYDEYHFCSWNCLVNWVNERDTTIIRKAHMFRGICSECGQTVTVPVNSESDIEALVDKKKGEIFEHKCPSCNQLSAFKIISIYPDPMYPD